MKEHGAESDYDPYKHDDDFERLQRNYEDITYTLQRQVKKVEVGYDADTLKEMVANA